MSVIYQSGYWLLGYALEDFQTLEIAGNKLHLSFK